jgi:hypothetical protein
VYRMAARPQKHLTDDERRALQLLAVNLHGATVEALVLGRGFKLQMLDESCPCQAREALSRDGNSRRPNDWSHRHLYEDHGRRPEGNRGAGNDGGLAAQAASLP